MRILIIGLNKHKKEMKEHALNLIEEGHAVYFLKNYTTDIIKDIIKYARKMISKAEEVHMFYDNESSFDTAYFELGIAVTLDKKVKFFNQDYKSYFSEKLQLPDGSPFGENYFNLQQFSYEPEQCGKGQQ